MTYRIRNIAVAVGLALVAALLTTFYVANYKRHVRQTESTVTVYRRQARHPAGDARRRAHQAGWIRTQDVVQRTVVPGRDLEPRPGAQPDHAPGHLRGRAGVAPPLRRPRRAGRPLPAARYAARDLGPGHARRSCSRERSRDGDHVDVIANLKTGRLRDVLRSPRRRTGRARAARARRRRRTERQGRREPGLVGAARSSRQPRGPEDLVRGRELGRLGAAAPPGCERDRQPGGRRRHLLAPQGRRVRRERCSTTSEAQSDRADRHHQRTRLYFTGDCDGLRRAARSALPSTPSSR